MPKLTPPMLVSLRRIWDYGEHNAFTDLLIYEGKFFVAFREAASHETSNGIIRVIASSDGNVWESQAVIEVEGVDLRDPKLSIMPDGRLHLLMGASIWDRSGQLLTTGTRVSTDLFLTYSVLPTNSWLWRLTWHKGIGYGVSYDSSIDPWQVSLYKTSDGINFTRILDFGIEGYPSEATVRFDANDQMLILLRRSETWRTHALLGNAYPPYQMWDWYDLGYSLGGPNFIFSPQGNIYLAGRLLYAGPWGLFSRTALLSKDQNTFRRELILPSFGDTSYPGLAWHEGYLYMSYYSTHEEKTAIYLAKILAS